MTRRFYYKYLALLTALILTVGHLVPLSAADTEESTVFENVLPEADRQKTAHSAANNTTDNTAVNNAASNNIANDNAANTETANTDDNSATVDTANDNSTATDTTNDDSSTVGTPDNDSPTIGTPDNDSSTIDTTDDNTVPNTTTTDDTASDTSDISDDTSAGTAGIGDMLNALVELPPEPILRLALPVNLNFMLDPYELSGNGSLYSPQYSIINYSNVDVDLSINGLAYTFSDNGKFLSCSEPPEYQEKREEKAIYMFLRQIAHPVLNEDSELEEANQTQLDHPENSDFIIMDHNDGNSYQIHLKAANYDENGEFISLNEGSVFLFTIMGNIQTGTSAPWRAGDVTLNMTYSWTPTVPIIDLTDVTAEEMQTADETQTTDETQSVDQTQTTDETQSADQTQTADETQSTDQTQTTDETQSTDQTPTTDETQTTDQTQTTDETQSTDKTQSTDQTQSTDKTQSTDQTQTIGKTQPTNPTQTTDETQSTDQTQTIGKTQSTDQTQTIGKTQPTNPTQTTDKTQPTGKTQATNETQSTGSNVNYKQNTLHRST